MAIEIISIPNVRILNDKSLLTTLEIELDSDSRLPKYNHHPISQTALLPIGQKIEKGINRSTNKDNHFRPERRYRFIDFSKGILQSLDDLPVKIYPMEVPHLIYNETMVYSVINKGKLVVFFAYELFRQFIGSDSDICRYIMHDDMLDMFIDSEDDSDVDGETSIELEFNVLMPARLAKSVDFLTSYIFLLYNKDLRRYWKEVQSNTDNGINNFAFKNPPFKQFDCTAQIRQYKDFDLVLSITSMDLGVEFPFQRVRVHHPMIKEIIKNPNGTKPKKSKMDAEVPKGYDFENQDQAPNVNKVSSLSISKPGIKFKKWPRVEKIKKKADLESKPKVSKILFEEFKLKDIELSFQEPENKGNVAIPVITDIEDESTFDFTKIPSGLQLFCNAIKILGRTMNLEYKYDLIPFHPDIKSKFATLGAGRRCAIVITFPSNPSIHILEVDSSDGKFISTLIFKDLKIKMSTFLSAVFTRLAITGGSWDTEYLGENCISEKIRHPKKLAVYENMDQEKVDKSVKSRIAVNLLNILGG